MTNPAFPPTWFAANYGPKTLRHFIPLGPAAPLHKSMLGRLDRTHTVVEKRTAVLVVWQYIDAVTFQRVHNLETSRGEVFHDTIS